MTNNFFQLCDGYGPCKRNNFFISGNTCSCRHPSQSPNKMFTAVTDAINTGSLFRRPTQVSKHR